MDKHHYRIADIVSISLSIITLLTVISGGFLWVYKTDSVPSQVDSVEQRVDKIELQIVENNTKTELIYQGVLEIRSVLLRR